MWSKRATGGVKYGKPVKRSCILVMQALRSHSIAAETISKSDNHAWADFADAISRFLLLAGYDSGSQVDTLQLPVSVIKHAMTPN